MKIIKEFYCGRMLVRVFDSRNDMGECAGKEIAEKIKELLKTKETLNIMFAAAPSQNETLASLLSDREIEWNRINAFHMDEYVGLDPDNPAGFRNYLRRSIFDLRPFRSINLINGNAMDIEKEAERYSQLLNENPLDICILGIGENGHIAFNDPPVADFNDKLYVKVVELERKCREQQVHDGCFERIEDVPTHALTVTIPGLCSASWMYCSVPSRTKADAIYHVVNDDVSTACPATILKNRENAFLYTDKEAASLIL